MAMDLWKELLCFSVDLLLFSLSYGQYRHIYNSIEKIKSAQSLGCNPDPKNLSDEEKKVVLVQGHVKALGETISSIYSPTEKGVIQKITIVEHAVSRNSTGFWSSRERIIQEAVNSVPFTLTKGDYVIEIMDAKNAHLLDMDVVATKFAPANPSFWDALFSFMNGYRPRGLEHTEEMLKEGTLINGIGEIDKLPNSLYTLSPPSDGSYYILTSLPVQSLVKKLNSEKSTYKWLCWLFGVCGVCLGALLIRRGWNNYQRVTAEREMNRRLDEERRLRANDADADAANYEDVPEALQCVVCRVNRKEIILLPCAHFCLCQACSRHIQTHCPMCRAEIDRKSAVFL